MRLKMHITAKLLSTCITLLFVFTNSLATIIELDSKIIHSITKGQDVTTHDNLGANNIILHECHLSGNNRSQMNCNISGLPADTTKLQRCNLTINASNNDYVHFDVEDVYQFVDNKIIVQVSEQVILENYTTSSKYYKWFNLLHIFDNCEPVTTISFADEKDGITFDAQKIIIYEDGFDVFVRKSLDGSATLEYHSHDTNGKQIGNYTVFPEQLPYRSHSWHPRTHLVNYGKKHSRGVTFSSGYHFYPNGTIVQFADEQYRNIMKSETITNDVEDGPFFTSCAILPSNDSGESVDFSCWQYDMDHAQLTFKVEFTSPCRSSWITSIKNLSKGSFMLTIWCKSKMNVHVYWPDRSAFIDEITLGLKDYVYQVGDFDENTGEITMYRYNGTDRTIVRSHYLLQNYVTAH